MEDETIRGEVVTRPLLMAVGKPERYFRYPYLFTGPTKELKEAFEAFLRSRGYQNAPVTVDNADYMFNDILHVALEQKMSSWPNRQNGSTCSSHKPSLPILKKPQESCLDEKSRKSF